MVELVGPAPHVLTKLILSHQAKLTSGHKYGILISTYEKQLPLV